MKIQKFPLTRFVLTGLCLAAVAGRCYAGDSKLGMSDKSFVNDAYEAGLAEIKAGEMAQSKSSNADVKAFGEHMVKDHTKANEKLKTLAASKNVEVPESPSLVEQAKAKLLDRKTGTDFDKAFAKAMVSDHEEVVKEFEKEESKADDPEVKAFASKTLPTLKHHLSMAKELQEKVGE